MGVTRSNHCAYDVHYHVVFPVKYKKALLDQAITVTIQEIAKGLEKRYEVQFEKIGTDGDHIHILCSFHPKYGGADFVRIFRSITAKELFKQFPELRRQLWGGELWSDGYYIATVGERKNWKTVERYVTNQGKTTQTTTQLSLWH